MTDQIPSDIQSIIDEITLEVQNLIPDMPLRQEGDVSVDQLCRMWNKGDGAVKRIMKTVGSRPEVTGFQMLKVYDMEKHVKLWVLRKVPKTAGYPESK